ncbi:MAG: hypothetical protein ACOCVM_00765 [Desulfovibrionaceae bacterium]
MEFRGDEKGAARWMVTVAAVAVLTVLAASAWAGGGPSPESCEKIGLVDVECIVCDTGEYRGKVSVQAEYDPYYEDCMKRYREARNLCISTYSLDPRNIGCKWRYSIGDKEYHGSFPVHCKK